MLKSVLAGSVLLAAASCDDARKPPSPPIHGTPAIWEIASADGEVEGWLFGTIHALPGNARWRSEAVMLAVEEADLLAVEIAALDDGDAIAAVFARLSHTPGQPALTQRVPAELHSQLAELVRRSPYGPNDFTAVETWGAALILAQEAQSSNDKANGVDKALIETFRPGRPVREVEGAVAQLGVFDSLPEEDQRELLAVTIKEAMRGGDAGRKTAERWLAGDVEGMLDPGEESLLDDPELREALVEGRNRAWMPVITAMLEQRPRPLIAVGAGHMGGPEGLPVLLRAAGYTVTRMR
ncbi:TraB/GumN family protein [Altererythrobacter sp. MTPC7]|uniref:TraB/GumN family protein n=1 Tax=Altererythrobacter sp. MTPC7 TaxID=3056567 RepID=UPI0036F291BE